MSDWHPKTLHSNMALLALVDIQIEDFQSAGVHLAIFWSLQRLHQLACKLTHTLTLSQFHIAESRWKFST